MAQAQVDPPSGCRCRCTYLMFVRFITFLGSVAVIAVLIANIIAIFSVADNQDSTSSKGVKIVSSAYHVLMSVLFLLAMFDFTVIKTWFAFLDNWVFLGASMVYLGCVSLSLSVDASIDSDSQREAVRVICWVMIGVGGLFSVLGLCGGKTIKNRDARAEAYRKGQDTL